MDVKDLNKPQLIMLALLLSFVTSIATGITTVTLMQQAPPSVTVPINRVVRETVEKIVPVPGKSTVQTVVVKEEDLVVDAIAKNKSAVFSIIKEAEDMEGEIIEVSAGRGYAISKEGIIVADGSLVSSGSVFYVENDSGKFKAAFVPNDSASKSEFALLRIGAPLVEENVATFTVPQFGNLGKMKMGQKILVLGDAISSFIFDGSKNMKINATKANAGGMVLNLDGEVLGVVLSADTMSFAPIDSIVESLQSIENTPEIITN